MREPVTVLIRAKCEETLIERAIKSAWFADEILVAASCKGPRRERSNDKVSISSVQS
jgi:hypothetical protein